MKIIHLLAGLTVISCIGHPALAQQTPTSEHEALVIQQVKDLFSPQPLLQWKALQALQNDRGTLVRALLAQLEIQKDKPSRAFDGPFDTTLRAIGQLNVREATDPLLGLIGFQLDPATAPHGGFNGPESYYPVALTLLEISDSKELTRFLFEQFNKDNLDDRTLRVCVWTLQRKLGKDVAQFLVERELQGWKRMALPITLPEQFHLEKAQTWLAGKELILPEPQPIQLPPTTPVEEKKNRGLVAPQ